MHLSEEEEETTPGTPPSPTTTTSTTDSFSQEQQPSFIQKHGKNTASQFLSAMISEGNSSKQRKSSPAAAAEDSSTTSSPTTQITPEKPKIPRKRSSIQRMERNGSSPTTSPSTPPTTTNTTPVVGKDALGSAAVSYAYSTEDRKVAAAGKQHKIQVKPKSHSAGKNHNLSPLTATSAPPNLNANGGENSPQLPSSALSTPPKIVLDLDDEEDVSEEDSNSSNKNIPAYSILHSYGENENSQSLFLPNQRISAPQMYTTPKSLQSSISKVASCDHYSAFLLEATGDVIFNGNRDMWLKKPFVTLRNNLIYLRTDEKIVDIAATIQSCFLLTQSGALMEISEELNLKQLETPRPFSRLYTGLISLFGYTKNDKLWGIRGSGASLGLGREVTMEELGDNFEKMKLTKVIKHKIVKVACGLEHTLVLRKNGSVWVCGNNESGALGLSNNKIQVLTPIELSRDYFRMNISNTGVPNRTPSTTGTPATPNRQFPPSPQEEEEMEAPGGHIIDIAAGSNWSVFLDKDHNVYVCGNNAFRSLASEFDSVHVFGVRLLSNDLFFRAKIQKIFCSSTQTFFCTERSIFSTTTGKRYTPKKMQLQGKFAVRQVSCSQNQTFILSDPLPPGASPDAADEKKISKESMQIERLKNELEAMRLEHERIQREQDMLRRENIDFKLEVDSLNRRVEELQAENRHLADLSSSDPFIDIRKNVSTLLQTVKDHETKRDRYLAEYNFKHNDNLDDIAEVVRELLNNERIFLKNLQLLRTHFIEPYDQKYADRDPLPTSFREIDLIENLSSKHLSSLEEILYPWLLEKESQKNMEAALAKHFLFYSESFKLFKQYMLKHDHMLEALKEEPLKSFTLSVSKQLKANRTSGKDIYEFTSFLILPIQHSCRLSLYMERLVSKIPEGDPNRPIIQEALTKIKEVGSYNNIRLQQEENARTLQNLQQLISHHFLESHRKLLMIDEFGHRMRPSGDLIPCKVYCCTDLLILIDSSQFGIEESRSRSTSLMPSGITRNTKPRSASVRPRLSTGLPSRKSSTPTGAVKAQLIFRSKVCEFEPHVGGETSLTLSVVYITTEGRQERRRLQFSDQKYYEAAVKALQIE